MAVRGPGRYKPDLSLILISQLPQMLEGLYDARIDHAYEHTILSLVTRIKRVWFR